MTAERRLPLTCAAPLHRLLHAIKASKLRKEDHRCPRHTMSANLWWSFFFILIVAELCTSQPSAPADTPEDKDDLLTEEQRYGGYGRRWGGYGGYGYPGYGGYYGGYGGWGGGYGGYRGWGGGYGGYRGYGGGYGGYGGWNRYRGGWW